MTDKTGVIPLSKPIPAHGETLEELEIGQPTGEQVCNFGLPYTMSQDMEVSINMKVVKRYIMALAKIPSSSVDQLTPSDLNTIAWAIAGFFLKG